MAVSCAFANHNELFSSSTAPGAIYIGPSAINQVIIKQWSHFQDPVPWIPPGSRPAGSEAESTAHLSLHQNQPPALLFLFAKDASPRYIQLEKRSCFWGAYYLVAPGPSSKSSLPLRQSL